MPREAQLSIAELAAHVMHRLERIEATEDGYRPVCTCGRVGDTKRTKAEARGENLAHVARTPYGRAVYARLYR